MSALSADTPQGRPRLLSLLLNSTKSGCQHERGGQGQLCAGPGVIHRALAMGLVGGTFSLRGRRDGWTRNDSSPCHLRMSRISSRRQPRCLPVLAWAPLALWQSHPSLDTFWTVVLGLGRPPQKWAKLTVGGDPAEPKVLCVWLRGS